MHNDINWIGEIRWRERRWLRRWLQWIDSRNVRWIAEWQRSAADTNAQWPRRCWRQSRLLFAGSNVAHRFANEHVSIPWRPNGHSRAHWLPIEFEFGRTGLAPADWRSIAAIRFDRGRPWLCGQPDLHSRHGQRSEVVRRVGFAIHHAIGQGARGAPIDEIHPSNGNE